MKLKNVKLNNVKAKNLKPKYVKPKNIKSKNVKPRNVKPKNGKPKNVKVKCCFRCVASGLPYELYTVHSVKLFLLYAIKLRVLFPHGIVP